MKRRHHDDPRPEPAAEDAPPSRLADLRPHPHDDDERPTREDRATGHSRFEIPVPVPKRLRGRHRQRD